MTLQSEHCAATERCQGETRGKAGVILGYVTVFMFIPCMSDESLSFHTCNTTGDCPFLLGIAAFGLGEVW